MLSCMQSWSQHKVATPVRYAQVVHAALSVFEAASPSMKLLLDLLPTALKLLLEARPGEEVWAKAQLSRCCSSQPFEHATTTSKISSNAADASQTEVQIDPCSTRDAAVQRLCCAQWPSEQAAAILDIAQRLPL